MSDMRRLAIAVSVLLAVLGRLATMASAASTTTVEAEAFSLPSGSGQTFSDGSAGGGKGLLVWSNATASKTVTTATITKLTVRARGDQCSGAPKMSVSVDGRGLMSRTVSATSWTNYNVSVSRAAGSHRFDISFTNDRTTSSCDRNLRLDRIAIETTGTAPTPTPTPTPTTVPTPHPGTTMYVDPYSQAKQQADAWRSSRPSDAALLDKIASQPQGFWFGEWSGDVRTAVDSVMTAANGKTAVLVAYTIPQRDCGSYSAGGAAEADAYRSWIRSFAQGIGSRTAIVVLEPDALPGMTCLSEADRSTRFGLLRDAAAVLNAQPGASVYMDAGHSRWLSATEAAQRLNDAGVAQADGFSLNVSNFGATSGEVAYGDQVSALVGGKHFVVDTSRNGNGANNEWCNPSGRALGDKPTLQTGQPLVDGYLWVKRPGESDGTCNGGPVAGQFWPEYALGLAQRASW